MINWKDDKKALTKLYPRETDEEDSVLEHGSFFNFFVFEDDAMEVRVLDQWLPEINIFIPI